MPFALTIAAGLGARVIKVEGEGGDPWRSLRTSSAEVRAAQCLQGKESIGLNLRTEAGREVLDRLLGLADAVVYSFRADPAGIGLGYERLKKINPRIVFVNSPGYGSDMSELELLALPIPRLRGNAPGDGLSALGVFSALMLALRAQENSREGQFVETSMINSVSYGYSDQFMEGLVGDRPPFDDFDQLGPSALYRGYQASDGWVFLAITTNREWAQMVQSPGFEEIRADEQFRDEQGRRSGDKRLISVLSALFRTDSAENWEKRLCVRGIGCVKVFDGTASEFSSVDQGLRSNHLTYEVDHPLLGKIVRHGLPVRMSESNADIVPSTVFGQNTASVLAEIGYSQKEVEGLLSNGSAYGPVSS
jgi:crotonobetainyl-CoA:carnitine CoA-transferase CaiB-like acyl-CoA transferase